VPVHGLPAIDSKCEVPDIMLGGGGPGATAAVCLARLGAEVRLATVLGDDEGAAVQRRELEAAGVDCSLVTVARGHNTPRAVILVDPDAGTRTIFWSRGALPTMNARTADQSWLDGCDLLYCDGHEPDLSVALARLARPLGLPVVMDAGTVREGSSALVAVCTDVISSRTFAPDLTGLVRPVAALAALRSRGPARVAMTFGEAGVVALDEEGGEPFHVPAFDVPVCDTTGAGDTFHAGYAFARARGDRWPEALELGAAVAALKCRDWGGRRGLPSLAEAEALQSAGTRRPDSPPF